MAEFVELLIEAGTTYSNEITVREDDGTAKNLTNFTANSQLRKSYYSSTATDFTMTVTNAANGVITMSLSAANTANLRAGRYVYDVELTDNQGIVTRIFEGIAVVLPNVTR